MTLSSSNATLSFKSCGKCHDIYNHLQTHISLEHQPTGPEGVISNVIINLLSLLIPNLQMERPNEIKPKQQPSSLQTVPIPVIAKQPEKQINMTSSNVMLPPARALTALPPFSQEFSSNSSSEISNITNRLNLEQELQRMPISHVFNFAGKHQQQQQQQHQQQQQQQQQKQKQQQEEQQRKQRQQQLQQQQLQQQQQQQRQHQKQQQEKQKQQHQDQQLLQTQVSQSKQPAIPLNNLELQPVLIQQSPNIVGLFNPDGSLTPAGISLLLSYQSGRGNSGGKTDLDDIADILVNKMPIPSLKGLDPANFQLSTFYLQQLVLNQMQQALANTSASTTSSLSTQTPVQIDNTGVVPSSSSSRTEDTYTKSDGNSLEGKNVTMQDGGSDLTGSVVHELLERHKHINGLIAAWNTKSHADRNLESDFDQVVLPSIQNIQSALQMSTTTSSPSSLHMVPTPHILQPAHYSQVALSKQKETELPQHLEFLGHRPATVNITHMSHPTLTQVSAIDQNKDNASSSDESNQVDLSPVNSPGLATVNSTFQSLQSLILETAKRMATDSIEMDTSKTSNLIERNVVSVAVAPADLKSSTTTLQGIVVGRSNKEDGSSVPSNANAKDRAYPSMTVVPLSEYNSIDDVGEDGGQQSGSVVQQGDKVLYKCDYCGVTFSVLSTLHNHVKSAHGEKSEYCNYCQMSFTDHEEYYAHVASHRGEDNIYTCQFCTKIFTSHGDYKKHLAKHTQKRPYMCEHCQKTFRDPGSLAKHERIHTGEQPFKCTVCNRGFAEKSSLRKHSRVHSGEKPYKCQQCDKSFSISGNLQRHLLIHTGKKPFKCTLCTKAFNNPSHLRRHVKNLHNKADDKNLPAAGEKNGTKMEVNNLVVPRASMMDAELTK